MNEWPILRDEEILYLIALLARNSKFLNGAISSFEPWLCIKYFIQFSGKHQLPAWKISNESFCQPVWIPRKMALRHSQVKGGLQRARQILNQLFCIITYKFYFFKKFYFRSKTFRYGWKFETFFTRSAFTLVGSGWNMLEIGCHAVNFSI